MYSMSTKIDPQVLIEDLWSSLRKSLKLCCPDLKEIVNGGEVDECNRVSQQNVQRKQQDCERANLDYCEIDNSESWSRKSFPYFKS